MLNVFLCLTLPLVSHVLGFGVEWLFMQCDDDSNPSQGNIGFLLRVTKHVCDCDSIDFDSDGVECMVCLEVLGKVREGTKGDRRFRCSY